MGILTQALAGATEGYADSMAKSTGRYTEMMIQQEEQRAAELKARGLADYQHGLSGSGMVDQNTGKELSNAEYGEAGPGAEGIIAAKRDDQDQKRMNERAWYKMPDGSSKNLSRAEAAEMPDATEIDPLTEYEEKQKIESKYRPVSTAPRNTYRDKYDAIIEAGGTKEQALEALAGGRYGEENKKLPLQLQQKEKRLNYQWEAITKAIAENQATGMDTSELEQQRATLEKELDGLYSTGSPAPVEETPGVLPDAAKNGLKEQLGIIGGAQQASPPTPAQPKPKADVNQFYKSKNETPAESPGTEESQPISASMGGLVGKAVTKVEQASFNPFEVMGKTADAAAEKLVPATVNNIAGLAENTKRDAVNVGLTVGEAAKLIGDATESNKSLDEVFRNFINGYREGRKG